MRGVHFSKKNWEAGKIKEKGVMFVATLFIYKSTTVTNFNKYIP